SSYSSVWFAMQSRSSGVRCCCCGTLQLLPDRFKLHFNVFVHLCF
uniref:Uncharacterized protein n=1 Tax=Triticum urartu TaxID=4572 RepID=A0A8R7NZ12_TRIUA